MSKRIEKTDNYFERVKQRADRTNYRYYLFDYLYFKGEAWRTQKLVRQLLNATLSYPAPTFF